MKRMEIEYLAPEDITPYQDNAKEHDAVQIRNVAKSIEKYGWQQPLVIDKDNVIIVGHGRYYAALRLGIEEIPCLKATDLTEKQVNEYRLLDNKLNESEWNQELLDKCLKGLDFSEFDIDWGIPDIIEPEQEAQEDNYSAEPPEQPISKRGQVWKLGRHRVMCGSSTDSADMAKLMEDETADLLLTDPPYGVDYEGGTGMKIENDDMQGEEFIKFLTDAFETADQVMKPGAAFYIWHADGKGYEFNTAAHNAGWKIRQVVCWVKNSLVIGRQDYQWQHEPALYGWKEGAGHYFTASRKETTAIEEEELDLDNMKKEELRDLLERVLNLPSTVMHENKPARNDVHPTMKPVRLMAKLIQNSTKPGQIVLDSFGGSGSTLMAAEQLGRTCYTMELDPKYVDVIIDRWETFTGEKAELISEG